MSALAQKQTCRPVCVMSALPPIADIYCLLSNVRLVPKADICSAKEMFALVPIATCAVQLGISALGQKRKFAPQFVGHL